MQLFNLKLILFSVNLSFLFISQKLITTSKIICQKIRKNKNNENVLFNIYTDLKLLPEN